MPIDPRIPLGIQPPAPGPSILDTYQQITQLQGQREQREIQRLAAEAAKRAEESVTRLRAATKIDPATGQVSLDYAPLIGHVDPDKIANVQAAIARAAQEQQQLATSTATADEKKRAYLGNLAQVVKESGYDPQILNDVTTIAAAAGYLSPKEAESAHAFSRDDTFRKSVVDRAIALAPKKPEDPEALVKLEVPDPADPTKTVYQFVRPTENATFPMAQKAPTASEHSPIYKEWQDYKSTGGTLTFDEYMTQDANRKRPVTHVNTGQGTDADVNDFVDGVMAGTIPPDPPGRASPLRTKILAEFQRRGFNLAQATTDWEATRKHLATMNGAQQLRLNQAVNALPEMLTNVETLAKQWKAGRFPALNRVSLAAAKHGVYGAQAATIANQLDAQIADVVADLGNVYMGGNSPTDHALGLAAKSLNAEWSEPVLLDMVKLAKTNVQIRRNSINSTGVAGASADNPYAPPVVPAPPVVETSGGTAGPKVGERRMIQGQLAEWDGKGWKAVPNASR